MAKRKFRDGPLPGLDHFMMVIEGDKRTVTLAYPIMAITEEYVILEMEAGYLGFLLADLPGGDVLPMVGAREAFRLKDAIRLGQIAVKQPAANSADRSLAEMLSDIDEAVQAVLGLEGGAAPYLH